MKDPLLERGPHEVTLLLSEYANSITKPVSPCLLRSDSTVLIGRPVATRERVAHA